GVEAMIMGDAAVVDDLAARPVHVESRAVSTVAQAAKELRFDANGKVLIPQHRAAALRVKHHAAVAHCPIARMSLQLLADEAVLDSQAVVRKGFLVEKMSEAAVEALVLVVAHFEHAVFDPERVPEVFAVLVAGDFRRPSFEIAAIEKLDPFLRVRRSRCERGRREGTREYAK